jgi:hypothetical protein
MIYFIYKTTNLINGKTYIGMHSTNNIQDGYLGSGVVFKKVLKKYGVGNFKREILEFSDSYDNLIELEKKYVNEDVVIDDNTYNLKTGGQSNGRLSNESKIKISNTLKNKYKNGEIKRRYTAPYILTDEQKHIISKSLKKYYSENKHHSIGSEPWNKGKVGSQKAWNKGVETGPMGDDVKNKISDSMKEWHLNNKHPLLGVEPWNKGKVGVQKAWNKGKVMEKQKCPHCDKYVDVANGKRWHFDNCKLK